MNKAYIFVVLTAFLFGTMESACKIAGNGLDPFQLTFIRFAMGGIILLPFALREIKKNQVKLVPKDFLILAGVGTLGIAVSMVFFQLGVSDSNAATTSVLISINPLFTMVFAHFFTNEKMTIHKVYVLIIAFAGLVFMIRPWDIQEGNSIYGIVCMLIAAITFGAYTVAGKVSVKKMGLMAQTSFSFLLGSAVLLIMILIAGKPVIAGVGNNFPLILYVGIFVTGMGYWSYFKAIQLSDASTGSIAFFLKPAIAPVIAVIALGETILWNTYVGIILILIGSYMNIHFQRKANARKQQEQQTDNK
ncbi:MAG: DMT family transporter [Eubacterium sp.]|nr:DMT family transporter [Candidatus Colimonas fimequi]